MIENTRLTLAAGTNPDDPARPAFHDWANMVSIQPRLYFRPQSLDELKGLLTSMVQGSLGPRNLRVLGGLHSCSDLCVGDVIIDVSDLPRTIEFNGDHSVVTVSANWHLHDFLLAVSKHGKSISATGGTDHQTLAGVISTDTAPASPYHLIYEGVEWIETLTIADDGQSIVEKHVSKTDPAFPAAIGALGATGILTRLQVRLIDELYFETVQKIMKLKDVLTDVNQTSRQYDFWRIDWIPDTDVGLFWGAKRVTQADPDGDYAEDAAENILVSIYRVLDKVAAAGPLLDMAMRLVYAGLTLTYGEVKASGPLRNMLPVDRRAPLRVAMAEWSFNPVDLNRLLEACKNYFESNGWPNLPIEIELTKTDNFYMSAWNWPGLDYIIKFNFMYLTDVIQPGPEKEKIYSHLKGLWDHLRKAGIPFKAHWGKINFMDADFVAQNYQFESFKPYIRPLFLNRYLRERFYER